LVNKFVAGGRHFYFELSALHKKGGKWNFMIRSVPHLEEHKEWEQKVYFPFWALPWLRQQIVKILVEVELDGSEQIDEMPKIPEWAARGIFPNYKFSSNTLSLSLI
jgi:hypothetical protein